MFINKTSHKFLYPRHNIQNSLTTKLVKKDMSSFKVQLHLRYFLQISKMGYLIKSPKDE